ncbi:MAG: hypothetical protein KJ574_04520 [Nanoarchaeota archaeon]|nr:hypothetical protein [Nanoarchaeota archaeon]
MASKKAQKSDKERIDEGQLLLRVILEVAGSPKDHVEKAMMLLVDKLEEKDYISELVSEEVLEAKEHEKYKNLFTAIAELELWIKKPEDLIDLAFDFMPASIELVEPEKPQITNKVFTAFLNELMANLHKSDMTVKNLSAQKQVLERNANILLRNFIVNALKTGPKPLDEIAKIVGVNPEHLQNFLTLLEKGGELKKDNNHYLLSRKAQQQPKMEEHKKKEQKKTKKKSKK